MGGIVLTLSSVHSWNELDVVLRPAHSRVEMEFQLREDINTCSVKCADTANLEEVENSGIFLRLLRDLPL